MDFALKKIKRLIIQGNFRFTLKADAERLVDGLTQEDVLESILNASLVRTKKSHSPRRKEPDERMYIIESFTYDGILIYSKGVIRKEELIETFYIIVSAKRSTLEAENGIKCLPLVWITLYSEEKRRPSIQRSW